MAELFLRSANIKVGQTAAAGKLYDGYRIAFDIEKVTDSNPNVAKISIWNLQPETRAQLEKANAGIIVQLNAGYLGLSNASFRGPSAFLSELFLGDIARVNTKREGADVITTFEAGDGEKVLKSKKAHVSFAPGTPSATIVTNLLGQLGFPIGSIGGVKTQLSSVFKNGFSASGLIKDIVAGLAAKDGLQFSVIDGEVNLLPPDETTLETAVVVSASTGLIGFPSKSDHGIEFTSLLNTKIKPGRAIILKSNAINATLRAGRCVYKGDTDQGEFIVKVEATIIS